jgi:hypothetical protein
MGRNLIDELEAAISNSNLDIEATPPGVASMLSPGGHLIARRVAAALLLIRICFHALCRGVLEYKPHQQS